MLRTHPSQRVPHFTGLSAVIATALIAGMPAVAKGLSAPRAAASKVVSPQSRTQGATYAQWSARWWQWAMELPVDGHPFIDDPSFDVTSGQSGSVWFLAAPFGTVERTCTVPTGTYLFVGLLNAEASDLEGLGDTPEDQLATAQFLADHIRDVSCSVDGDEVANLGSYRVASPQFDFDAPTPWIFGDTGGEGTSTADGYYVMIRPLSSGQHTLQYSGSIHFSVAEGDPFDFDTDLDMTYHLTVRD
jgi:hypothetical protein